VANEAIKTARATSQMTLQEARMILGLQDPNSTWADVTKVRIFCAVAAAKLLFAEMFSQTAGCMEYPRASSHLVFKYDLHTFMSIHNYAVF
jgi:hypothetical protein